VLLTKYYLDGRVREGDMGAHVARTGGKDIHKGFRWQNFREINHFEDQEVHLNHIKFNLQNGGCMLALAVSGWG